MTGASAGRHELPQDSFDERAEETGARPLRLDLRQLLPDIFVGTERVPRLLSRAWRQAADEAIDIDPGAYTYRGGTVIDVLFDNLPEKPARLRLGMMGERIISTLLIFQQEQAASPTVAPDAPATARGREAGEKLLTGQQVETDFARLMREGIGVNPGDDIMRLWAARVMYNMLHSRARIPLQPEMMDLVAASSISYMPFLDDETEEIAGSLAVIKGDVPPEKYNTGEIMRQDLVMLFSAAVQLYYMRTQGGMGAIIVPVRAQTLDDAPFADLYRSFLPRLSAEVGHSIILEVRGLPPAKIKPGLADTIAALSNAVKACIFEVAPEARHSYLNQFAVLHACGFSVGAGRPDAGKWQRFADYYGKIGIKTYITGVSDAAALVLARQYKFTYIAGTVLGALQKRAYPAQRNGIG